MGAALAWFVTVVLLLGGVLVLFHLGVNLGLIVDSALRGMAQTLARPLVTS